MIDLTVNEEKLERAVARARDRGILIPTLRQQRDPDSIPETLKERLKGIGLWDVRPLNLFPRIAP